MKRQSICFGDKIHHNARMKFRVVFKQLPMLNDSQVLHLLPLRFLVTPFGQLCHFPVKVPEGIMPVPSVQSIRVSFARFLPSARQRSASHPSFTLTGLSLTGLSTGWAEG